MITMKSLSRKFPIHEFIMWIDENKDAFYDNTRNLGFDTKELELREWIEMFLKWTGYEENK